MEMIAIKAHYDGKVLVPEGPVKLPKGKLLHLQAEVAPDRGKKKRVANRAARKGLYRLGSNPVKCGVTDASVNHDKYIYTGM
jgi:hypothetical protein